ncbi:rod-binding protein [Planktotalea sp.]|uniref:rod-binding protein n=1 Tax=Planktotalea sp. TaxID=2029877 RepID=UPI003C717EDE
MVPLVPNALATASPMALQSKDLTVGQKLESVFLAEMLKAAGVGETPDAFGGGAGEDQFASFLREAQAREMVRAGGLGLATYFDQSILKQT